MNQTVTILTTLMICMLLVSGFILTGSMEQAALIEQKEAELASMSKELKALQKQLDESVKARDALNAASAAARETAQQQAHELELHQAAAEELASENTALQQALDESASALLKAEAEIIALQEAAAESALWNEQRAQENAQTIAVLQNTAETLTQALNAAPTPEPTPSPSTPDFLFPLPKALITPPPHLQTEPAPASSID